MKENENFIETTELEQFLDSLTVESDKSMNGKLKSCSMSEELMKALTGLECKILNI